ncbi:MAG: DUF6455 family protein [Antarcticimicrobium sp.]|uniref:DUF6455 family protein n=1 Tax=Antarcticimicrobium sp. TaxID=2824147 RepID=UPI00260ECAE3|nr:DUF6455 family protein [Antarcticimicrobium sp.]MDF1718715.1 DUF6455 family protein [Antarcticimicrobium sp.]
MGIIDRLSTSTDLVLGMAERLGVDMDAVLLHDPERGGLRLRSLALRCSGCPKQGGCAELQRACEHLDAAPGYCRNKAFLDYAAHT